MQRTYTELIEYNSTYTDSALKLQKRIEQMFYWASVVRVIIDEQMDLLIFLCLSFRAS